MFKNPYIQNATAIYAAYVQSACIKDGKLYTWGRGEVILNN